MVFGLLHEHIDAIQQVGLDVTWKGLACMRCDLGNEILNSHHLAFARMMLQSHFLACSSEDAAYNARAG